MTSLMIPNITKEDFIKFKIMSMEDFYSLEDD